MFLISIIFKGSHNLHTLFIPNRRAYSLELASYPNYPTVHSHHIQPGCEVAVAPQLMHVFYQQDSTSTDPGSTQVFFRRLLFLFFLVIAS